jgi:hypothetical protein
VDCVLAYGDVMKMRREMREAQPDSMQADLPVHTRKAS